ncbi:TIGR03085 family protein [Rhodococcus sp. 14-2483-1-1]|nr:TIGR03085 family protein [Rhodococcus sp. WWJCD1]OZE74941.1 TIGR03085 family protein [Rhodococcus sp. 15-649-2-2]OZF30357.1 TIGR03085 family protein [Rhodococcus sp. 14-2483-1-1]
MPLVPSGRSLERVSLAQDERSQLVQTLLDVGPDAPTLCGEWTAADLAAHLVVRERRLDASPGILLPPLAGYTERVQRSVANRPFAAVVEDVRTGPPMWSPFALLDPLINLGEMFVHHEDLRRATGSWTRRNLPVAVEKRLWPQVRFIGRAGHRSAPIPVHARTPDGRAATFKGGSGAGVTVVGEPSELLLYAFGRDQLEVEFEGSAGDVAAVKALDLSF